MVKSRLEIRVTCFSIDMNETNSTPIFLDEEESSIISPQTVTEDTNGVSLELALRRNNSVLSRVM